MLIECKIESHNTRWINASQILQVFISYDSPTGLQKDGQYRVGVEIGEEDNIAFICDWTSENEALALMKRFCEHVNCQLFWMYGDEKC